MRSLVRILPLLLVCACQGLPGTLDRNRTESLEGAGLEASQPADIALAPLRDQSAKGSAPTEALREVIQEGLIGRLYSPLDLAFVDAHWEEGSFAGAPPPDALLVISMIKWDEKSLRSSGWVDASAELRLYEGGSPEGPLLWGVRMDRRVDLNLREGQVGLLKVLRPKAVEAFGAMAVDLLPKRDAAAAKR